jgi:outer membrane protein assembly factor BamA
MNTSSRHFCCQWTALIATAILFSAGQAGADRIVDDKADEGKDYNPRILLPYAFSVEGLDTGIGAFYFRNGVWQEQDGLFATVYGTSNSSYGIFAGLFQLRLSERWYLDPRLGFQSNDEQRFYGDLSFREGGKPPSGSNDSAEDDFLAGEGNNGFVDLTFRYVLPTGAGRETGLTRYITDDGILADGSTNTGSWNPLETGRTFLLIKPFYQRRTIDVDDNNIDFAPPEAGIMVGDEIDFASNGIEIALEYDNRDFAPNPSKGSFTRIGLIRDFGWWDSKNSWTAVDFQWSKYVGLGETDWFRQQVLAFDFWTAWVPTWDEVQFDEDLTVIENRPPGNLGASLGGQDRLRGFPWGRFNDKAGILYSAEYRVIPRWNPMKNWIGFRSIPWRWWQAVVFGEVGRVADDYDLGDLHEDMKWTAGFGFRGMIGSGVIRFDFAWSDEVSQVWVFAGQSF